MNIITFTGPPGAGKDAVIERLLQKFERNGKVDVGRSVYYSTRKKRPTDVPGKNILLISVKEFKEKQDKGLIVAADISNGDLVGHSLRQLQKNTIVLASVSRKNIPELKKLVKKYNGFLFTIYIDAPLKQRLQRLIKRADSKDKNYIKHKIKNGVGFVKPSQRKIFNKIYKNTDGNLNKNTSLIYKELNNYINNINE